jgi:soluble cytochrome b562
VTGAQKVDKPQGAKRTYIGQSLSNAGLGVNRRKDMEMGKIASDTTLLRTAKYELVKMKASYSESCAQRDSYRVRASKAEQEAKEWKERFDILLRRDDVQKLTPNEKLTSGATAEGKTK